jgi:outer membrane protein OmpA-like peptidoglycan-associated protein
MSKSGWAPWTVLALAAVLGGCGHMSEMETQVRILAEPACTDFFFPIYFANRSDRLSLPARALILHAGRHARGCEVAQVQVVGLADDNGPADARLALSRQRARHVAEALMAAGLPPAQFQLSPLGDAAPAPRPDAPLKRRADVYIRFVH